MIDDLKELVVRDNKRLGPTHEQMADRIRKERKRLRLTERAAAARMGIGRETYRHLERRADPKLSTLMMLASAGFRVDALIPDLIHFRGLEGFRWKTVEDWDATDDDFGDEAITDESFDASTPN